MSNILQCKIVQIRLKELLFQKCSCKGYVIPAVTSGLNQDKMLYCARCNKIVEKTITNYTFEMTVLNLFENVIETLSVYDDVAEAFIGCSPEHLIRYLEEDNALLTKLEEVAKGLYISVETFPKQETKTFSSKKAKKITLECYENKKLLDILNKSL